MHHIFHTDEINIRERLDYWIHLISRTLAPVEFENLERGRFYSSLELYQLGQVQIADISSSKGVVNRTKRFLARSGTAYSKVLIQTEGEVVYTQRSYSAHLKVGDAVMINCMIPYSLNYLCADTSHIVVHFPSDFLKTRLVEHDLPTLQPFSTRSGMGKVTLDMIQSLIREKSNLAQLEIESASRFLVDILCKNLQHQDLLEEFDQVSTKSLRKLEVKRFIQQHLHDPDLSIDVISSALSMSKGHLHTLFKEENQTITRYIWEERLKRCHNDLKNPVNKRLTITAIAIRWGFSNMAHFSRTFKERYGFSPTEFRNSIDAS